MTKCEECKNDEINPPPYVCGICTDNPHHSSHYEPKQEQEEKGYTEKDFEYNHGYECNKCAAKYYFTSGLEKHMKTHAKKQPKIDVEGIKKISAELEVECDIIKNSEKVIRKYNNVIWEKLKGEDDGNETR